MDRPRRRWSARHRWPVFVLWFVATIGLFAGSLAAGGTRAGRRRLARPAGSYESSEAYLVYSARTRTRASRRRRRSNSCSLSPRRPARSTTRRSQAAIADIAKRLAALQSTVDGVDGPVLQQLVDPLTAPRRGRPRLARPVRPPDRGQVMGDGAVLAERLAPVPEAALDEIRAAYPSLGIHALNNSLANDEISELINSGLDRRSVLTIPITFAILLIAFGAVVAAVVPLVLAITALLAAFGMLGLYSQLVTPVSPYASQLVVLIGLAVAVDYSLFMVTRVPDASGGTAVEAGRDRCRQRTAGRAVFFSGLAVMISIGGLFLLDDPLFRSMAVGDDLRDPRRGHRLAHVPARDAGDPRRRRRTGCGSHTSAATGRRAAASGRALVRARRCAGRSLPSSREPRSSWSSRSRCLRLHLGQADFSVVPRLARRVQAVNLLNEKWPTGSGLELSMSSSPTPTSRDEGRDREDRRAVTRDPGRRRAAGDAPRGRRQDRVHLVHDGRRPQRPAQPGLVRQIRTSVVPAAFAGSPASARSSPATPRRPSTSSASTRTACRGHRLRAEPVVPAAARRVPLDRHPDQGDPPQPALDRRRVRPHGAGLPGRLVRRRRSASSPAPIESFVPVFIFTILFGLSMDYHVFILTRIKEARDHGMSSNEAVARGIAITSGTITSAAAIMVCVFAVFVTLPLTIIKQLGLGLAVAIFLDATIVRSILLPATMRLLGDWNWWLPRWLEWLPRVTIEATSRTSPRPLPVAAPASALSDDLSRLHQVSPEAHGWGLLALWLRLG